MQKNIRNLTISALFIALYVVLSYFAINLKVIKFTFSGFPLILGSLLLGPYYGTIIAGSGALLEQMIRYGLSFNSIIWIMPVLIRGLVIGLYAKKKDYNFNTFELSFIMISSGILLSLLNTLSMFIDSKIMGYYNFHMVFGMAIPRIINTMLMSIIYIPIVKFLLARLKVIFNQSEIINK